MLSSRHPEELSRRPFQVIVAGLALALVATPVGCGILFPPDPPPSGDPNDPTNGGASYVGSAACGFCHGGIAQPQGLHGHSHALSRIQGLAPEFPGEADRADVPNPPDGKTWADVSYVISGYTQNAFFVDLDGFVMTDGIEGVNTQWNLAFPPNETEPNWAPYEPNEATPLPFGYSCFRCHTTGAQEQDPNSPEFQDNRPGMAGIFQETGVQCERCHGPASKHVGDSGGSVMYIGGRASDCGQCHIDGGDPNVISAQGGFVNATTQWPQLLASGGHSGFDCTVCHNPHASIIYDREDGLRNDCADCHVGQSMALHGGLIYVRGDYVEQMNCQSCHMSFIAKAATEATAGVVGAVGRAGDVRGHICRIDTSDSDYTAMFTQDGSRVVKDDQGRAAVTLDFVCIRCHNGIGNAFNLTLKAASIVSVGLHE
jgi:hypothetical protein